MKLQYLLGFIILVNNLLFSQVKTTNNNVWVAKEYSKDVALYNSKNFLFKDVLGSTTEIVQFEIIPLAAASSGELTTLLYKCESKQKEGLVLGFYGNYWNDAGVLYQGYAFKNFEKNEAIEFLNKIQTAIEDNKKFINDQADNNNIFFKYDDIDVLIYSSSQNYTIRLFWKGFDSSWEKTAFDRSKRRFEKKIK
ncbi:hypothetical protein KHA90_07020 [Flavobacterium psychroterrae]|uniref:Uncharacterized protein n=1 Tax=Flavobacterium psychroterrae TaxID=2133767 RepID=A0ABS5PA85_9FLAO|nr:hypothetical protein [Flavobacterium psychroterrae]MBS7230770.1 hypothetical protein [Flavobacterium psychroterrae]